MLQLREYQQASLDALWSYWGDGGGNGLIVLPTGAGKALVIAALVKRLLEECPGLRVAIVTHVKELVDQNHKELKGFWPGAPAGIYSAGLNRRDTRSKILFCGIQSVARKVRQIGAFDLVIVDEAHLIPRNARTQYGRFFSDLRNLTPHMRVVGLTATPYRLDSGRMDEGDDRLFDDIVYDANVGDLIAQKYLSPLVSKATATTFDLSGVGKRGGEYIAGQLEAAVDQDEITAAAVREMIEYGHDRKAWLAFCAGVGHAKNVRDAVRGYGLSAEMVTGETPSGERDSIIRRYKAGQIRCLTSVGVLTTGFNVPSVDLVALLRPTQSPGLYYQMVGRALRLCPGKDNALILDYAGCVRVHGPIDNIKVKKPGKGEGEMPVKECPACNSYVPAGALTCQDCGHEFPPREEVKHAPQAENVAILSSEIAKIPPEWVEVDSWSARRHRKKDKPDSLKVTFHCGFEDISTWICLEHGGYATAKAVQMLQQFCPNSVIPDDIESAIRMITISCAPSHILVRTAGQFPEVLGCDFLEPAHQPERLFG